MYVGRRVSYNGELCTIRYIGDIEGTKGEWLGVEWDDATRGKHNGEAGGKRYFTCASRELKAASFVRPTRKPDEPRTFLEALQFKYASDHVTISFQIGSPAPEKAIRISGKEVEEIGFDKISKQLADLHELRIVLLDGLCIHQPLDQTLWDAWSQVPGGPRSQLMADIHDTCPKVVELDLSRNLFESVHEVAAICEQLEQIKTLRLDGNRFENVSLEEHEILRFRLIFAKVDNLTLENLLLKWHELVALCSLFPALQTLSLSSNEFEQLDAAVSLESFPAITTLKLGSNNFNSLSDIAALTSLPVLQRLVLKSNNISSVSQLVAENALLFSAISDLDLSYNSISSWAFVDDLVPTFPALTSLRISHNPLFTNLRSPTGRELTPEDGYMLVIARIPNLTTLNFSAVTSKDRLNAESYYLSLIVQQLSLGPEAETERVISQHPRWKYLCEEYSEPEIKREAGHVDPRSLAARLLTITFCLTPRVADMFGKPIDTKITMKNIPKRLNIYAVLGLVAKKLGQPYVLPGLSLACVTEEWEVRIKSRDGNVELLVENDETRQRDGERVRREIKLLPQTRGIGSFLEESNIEVRVDYEKPEQKETSYQHPFDSSS